MRLLPIPILCCLAAGSAQVETRHTMPAEPPPLLAKALVARVSDGKATSLHLPGLYRGAEPQSAQVFTLSEHTIDLGTKRIVTYANGQLTTRDLKRKTIWTKPIVLAPDAPRWVVGGMVLASPKSGGIVAFSLTDGRRAWTHAAAATRIWAVHNGLVVATTKESAASEIVAVATKNGALACRMRLPQEVEVVTASRHGIAVSGTKYFEVFDRFGPSLFRNNAWTPSAITAHARGFYVRTRRGIVSVDTKGKQLWATRHKRDGFGYSGRMLTLANDNVLLIDYRRFSDSGARCHAFDAKTGERLWTRAVEGLMVDHSKYTHEVYARVRKGRIDIVSQGAGGCFLVVLDATDGRPEHRVEIH